MKFVKNSVRNMMCMGIVLCFIASSFVGKDEVYAKDKPCDIVFALDMSGSMKQTDEHRIAIDTIKMMIDECEDQDSIGFVAYNDTIAYESNLCSLKEEENREQLKQMVDAIEYRGETDLGLGLRQAVKFLEASKEEREKIVILLSDGNTDLEQSNTGRTYEDSEKDLQTAMEVAKEKGIVIHTIGFGSEYIEGGDYLSVISMKTNGTSHHIGGLLQLNRVLNDILIRKNENATTFTDVLQPTGELETVTLKVKNQFCKSIYLNLISTETIQEVKVLTQGCKVFRGDKYVLLKFYDAALEEIAFEIKGVVDTTIGVELVEIPENRESTLTQTPPTMTEKPTVTCTPVPVIEKENDVSGAMVVGVMIGIMLATLLGMGGIVYLFFGRKKEEAPKLHGRLVGEFLDLKSKNESVSLAWNLEEYPEEGVSLKELFIGAGFCEDLPEIERVCFYPEKYNCITLVHCMEGGIFLGDENIFPNKPTKLKPGDVIFISFADNSSELEMKYM